MNSIQLRIHINRKKNRDTIVKYRMIDCNTIFFTIGKTARKPYKIINWNDLNGETQSSYYFTDTLSPSQDVKPIKKTKIINQTKNQL